MKEDAVVQSAVRRRPGHFGEPGGNDWLVTTYVLDLLDRNDIETLLNEAHRVRTTGEMLCVASLTKGRSLCGRSVSVAWNLVHRLHPQLSGGCRPIELLQFIKPPRWKVVHRRVVQPCCIPSEIVVVRKITS